MIITFLDLYSNVSSQIKIYFHNTVKSPKIYFQVKNRHKVHHERKYKSPTYHLRSKYAVFHLHNTQVMNWPKCHSHYHTQHLMLVINKNIAQDCMVDIVVY